MRSLASLDFAEIQETTIARGLKKLVRKLKKIRGAVRVLHHDDPPCTARLKDGYCESCELRPDMQSTALYPYCPKCDIPLKSSRCSDCKKNFKT